MTTILIRAIVVMLICWLIGRLIGWVAQRTVDEHITKVINDHPAPSEGDFVDEVAGGAESNNAGNPATPT